MSVSPGNKQLNRCLKRELPYHRKSFFDHLTCTSNQSEGEADIQAHHTVHKQVYYTRLTAQRETAEGQELSGEDVWRVHGQQGATVTRIYSFLVRQRE